jgi:hypothetical protein
MLHIRLQLCLFEARNDSIAQKQRIVQRSGTRQFLRTCVLRSRRPVPGGLSSWQRDRITQ